MFALKCDHGCTFCTVKDRIGVFSLIDAVLLCKSALCCYIPSGGRSETMHMPVLEQLFEKALEGCSGYCTAVFSGVKGQQLWQTVFVGSVQPLYTLPMMCWTAI